MPRMGRPRTVRKDLPDWLYYTERRGFYFYRVRNGKPQYEGIGKVSREDAIKRWVKITGHAVTAAADGTVAELIDAWLQDELPRKLKAGKVKPVTAKEYRRQAPLLRVEFGAKRYARTPSQSMDADVLRKADVNRYMRRFEGQPGAVSANRMISLLSTIFAFAEGDGYCTYNPCAGARQNDETPRDRPVTQAERDSIAEHAPPAYRLMLRLTEATGMRLTDVRGLRLQFVGAEAIDLRQSKRGVQQRWEITPAVRAILDEAATLPGRSRSMYVFPSPKGTPYTEEGVHYQRRVALVRAGITDLHHRDVRSQAINDAKDAGMNATDFAGHTDERTTQRHYLTGPRKVKPIR